MKDEANSQRSQTPPEAGQPPQVSYGLVVPLAPLVWDHDGDSSHPSFNRDIKVVTFAVYATLLKQRASDFDLLSVSAKALNHVNTARRIAGLFCRHANFKPKYPRDHQHAMTFANMALLCLCAMLESGRLGEGRDDPEAHAVVTAFELVDAFESREMIGTRDR